MPDEAPVISIVLPASRFDIAVDMLREIKLEMDKTGRWMWGMEESAMKLRRVRRRHWGLSVFILKEYEGKRVEECN
jgi:hypothetical protein